MQCEALKLSVACRGRGGRWSWAGPTLLTILRSSISILKVYVRGHRVVDAPVRVVQRRPGGDESGNSTLKNCNHSICGVRQVARPGFMTAVGGTAENLQVTQVSLSTSDPIPTAPNGPAPQQKQSNRTRRRTHLDARTTTPKTTTTNPGCGGWMGADGCGAVRRRSGDALACHPRASTEQSGRLLYSLPSTQMEKRSVPCGEQPQWAQGAWVARSFRQFCGAATLMGMFK